ncbi:hypothetical protein DWV13_01880 [Clostridium botulinum]|uniref:hypothetical protein n=1 Tax=Clostridium TaxID=1485 RepID=UPI0013F7C0E6|nr:MULTISPECIES: hypothetical protein [Clostridium]MCS6103456.1 hypothetical protein [Clostridium botulinum]MCS6106525.1 hypothetical protein [Clostridium botulinum]MCS6130407.1 hypothetical protein [Clostridium botulinum]NFL44760.1 hypothetical protein [Clostridium botulinum]NFL88805.1 hypothetical protein [Clostridium botulinum]
MLNVYILERKDEYDYDQCIEQTIVAKTEERAIELADKEYGIWEVTKIVDLNLEQVLTKETIDG